MTTRSWIGVCLVAASIAFAQTPPQGAPGGGQRHAMPDPNKPAGEAFKNVQLLKDMPAGQFFGVMQSFSASLGVKCDACHVEGNFASDDKPEKKTARAMLTMVQGINQQYFNGRMEVRCYTCHHGSEHPVSKPPADATRPAGPGADEHEHPADH